GGNRDVTVRHGQLRPVSERDAADVAIAQQAPLARRAFGASRHGAAVFAIPVATAHRATAPVTASCNARSSGEGTSSPRSAWRAIVRAASIIMSLVIVRARV